MKKTLLFFFSLLTISAFADTLVLNNQTPYPDKKTKIAIQWASSAKDINEANTALIQGSKLDSSTIQMLSQSKKVTLTIPEKAEYFRILVWTKDEPNPDLHTNWVDIVPGKTYTLKTDQLIPTVLAVGMGC